MTDSANDAIAELFKLSSDPAQVADLLVERVNVNPALREDVLGDTVRQICLTRVHNWLANQRRSIVRDHGLNSRLSADEWVNAVSAGLMENFRLPGGKLLGDATRTDLSMAAHAYSTKIGDMLVKRDWLALMVKEMPDERLTVREVFNEERLKALKTAAARSDRQAA